MATRTPQRQESGRDFVDKEWVCEHARQVGLYPQTLSLIIEMSCLTQTSYILALIAPVTVLASVFNFYFPRHWSFRCQGCYQEVCLYWESLLLPIPMSATYYLLSNK